MNNNQKLLNASACGNLKSVRQILATNKVDINFKDILMKNIHDI